MTDDSNRGSRFTTRGVDAYRAKQAQEAAASAPAAGEQAHQGLSPEAQHALAELSAAVEDALAYVLQKRAARQAAEKREQEPGAGPSAAP